MACSDQSAAATMARLLEDLQEHSGELEIQVRAEDWDLRFLSLLWIYSWCEDWGSRLCFVVPFGCQWSLETRTRSCRKCSIGPSNFEFC